MKKKVFKLLTGATLLVVMAISVQMNKTHEVSAISLDDLKGIALADGYGEVDLGDWYIIHAPSGRFGCIQGGYFACY